MKQPKFSIVIPTRDRWPQVRGVLRNVRQQMHDSFEIVLSDNSTDNCTEEIVASVDDARVRYVRTPEPVLMHDSWTFAIGRARGEYALLLCDDDRYDARLLERVDHALSVTDADVVFWGRGTYLMAGSREMTGDAHIEFRTVYSDRLHEVDGAALIDDAYDMRITHNDYVPRMLNSAVRMDLVRRVEATGPRLFLPSCPDYSFMLAAAVEAERIVYLDAPLALCGLTPQSTGWNHNQEAEIDPGFTDALLRAEPDLQLPPALLTVSCWIAQTYMQCASAHEAIADRRVNFVHAYGIAGLEIEQWRARGFDVSHVEAAFRALLDGDLSDQREGILEFIAQRRTIESMRFLLDSIPRTAVIGRGAFFVPDADIHDAQWNAHGDITADLGTWLEAHALDAVRVMSRLIELAGDRSIVVYGLGNGGKMLARVLGEISASLPQSTLVHDDGDRDSVIPLPRLRSFDECDPSRHFVFVTPIQHEGMAKRLAKRGFTRGRSWVCKEDLLPSVRHEASASGVC